MKTNQNLKLLFLLQLFLKFNYLSAQCTCPNAYSNSVIDISSNNVTTIGSCILVGLHYSKLGGLVAGNTYKITLVDEFGFNKYITLRTVSGTLLTHGDSPLTWTSTISGEIRAHWTDDINCDVNPWCNIATGQNLTTPMPITMVGFHVKREKIGNLLEWITATETNNSHFEIERSYKQIEFKKIAEMKGQGNSTSDVPYSYLDNDYDNQEHIMYYRLKQIDYDGQFSYSDVVSVEINNLEENISVVFDQFTSTLELLNSNQNDYYEILLFDNLGRVILNRSWNGEQLNLIDLPLGLYIVTVHDITGRKVGKAKLVSKS